jgi:hypothetical protein
MRSICKLLYNEWFSAVETKSITEDEIKTVMAFPRAKTGNLSEANRTRGQGEGETRGQEISFPLSPLLLVPLSFAPYSPLPASSTFSSTTNQNTITPATRITPHSANAIANERVKCAMKPVTIGASAAPTLPPKF